MVDKEIVYVVGGVDHTGMPCVYIKDNEFQAYKIRKGINDAGGDVQLIKRLREYAFPSIVVDNTEKT